MIAVIDYGMGNLRSVAKALAHVAPEAGDVALRRKPGLQHQRPATLLVIHQGRVGELSLGQTVLLADKKTAVGLQVGETSVTEFLQALVIRHRAFIARP